MVASYSPNAGYNTKDRRPTPTPETVPQISYLAHDSCQNADGDEDELQTQNETDDIISQVLGNFGIWQLRSVLIIFLCKIPAAWFMSLLIFTATELNPNEEYWCDTSAFGDAENCSVSEDQCYVLVPYGDANYAIRQCQKFHYEHNFRSLIMEFDLVCLCDIFVAWSQYWHLFGMFLGGVVASRLMRLLSPRRVYIVGIWGLLACGTATGLVNDFSLHCSFRCLSAVCCCFMMTSGQVIFSDITAGKYRKGVLLLYETFWSVGLMLLPAIATFAQSWRQVYGGITSLPFIIVLLLPWLPDSPRWLLQHAEPTAAVEHVMDLVLRAARLNEHCSRVPIDLYTQLELLGERLREESPPARWLELWRGHSHAKLLMLATHMALATFLISHIGLLLNTRSFGRDYLAPNTICMGLAEIVGCLLALYLSQKHDSWKWQWAGGFCIVAGAIGCVCWLCQDAEMPAVYENVLWMFFAALPKAAVSCGQALLIACMSESLPAEKRGPFAFSVITWARVWLLSASFLTVLKQINIALSLSTFYVLVILGGICTCCLRTPQGKQPEERHQQREKEADRFSTHL
ncbi:GH19614 [Drosophila grimshawi]|uniref:GH19614 n=1 Tax=Drosophila grimshawi TaxID=7222 RepID=B4K0W4_DROGR|nr:GH19614 [Drosophila grimshawi]